MKKHTNLNGLTLSMGLLTAVFSISACASTGGGYNKANKPSFSQLDTDGDGKLSFAEFPLKQSKRGMSPETIFKRLDRNGDGYLSESEMPNRMRGR